MKVQFCQRKVSKNNKNRFKRKKPEIEREYDNHAKSPGNPGKATTYALKRFTSSPLSDFPNLHPTFLTFLFHPICTQDVLSAFLFHQLSFLFNNFFSFLFLFTINNNENVFVSVSLIFFFFPSLAPVFSRLTKKITKIVFFFSTAKGKQHAIIFKMSLFLSCHQGTSEKRGVRKTIKNKKIIIKKKGKTKREK